MEEKKTKALTRYVGIDLGKRTYTVAFVGKGGKVTMSNGKTYPDGRQALYKKLRPEDKVAIEAGTMGFIMAKEIQAAVGCRVYVLNPYKLAVIYSSMKKTDKEDSLKLAHILEDCREERLPEVPVPSEKEMNRRKLLASYRRAQQERTRDINLLHALFISQGITTKVRSDLSTVESRQEAVKELRGIELREAEYLLKCLELCEARIAELDKEMKGEAAGDEVIERLQSVPGVGPMVAFAFAAHIDAARFENAGQVSNCIGLVPRVYMSGDTVIYGSITKRGNSFLRALLVQGAWALTRSKDGGKLKERYEYMTEEKSKSKKKTIVAIARRLAEEMYTLMKYGTRHEPRPFTPEKNKAKEIANVALSA